MRLYGKKISRDFVGKPIRNKIETRDGIIWSIDEANGIANVRIQGSSIDLKAHFHKNLQNRPEYLKEGASVLVRHKRGTRGFVEIIGTGRTIPTPVSGGSDLPSRTVANAILTGMDISAESPATASVTVADGTYRIGGVVYNFSEDANQFVVMNDPAPMVMGASPPVVMGAGTFGVSISAGPGDGFGRYDVISIDTAGNLTVTEGTPAALSGEPVMPSAPGGDLRLGHVFIYNDITLIDSTLINASWTTPTAQIISVARAGDINVNNELLWGTPDNAEVTYTISAVDQYAQAFNGGGAIGTLTLFGLAGTLTGTLSGTRTDYATATYNGSIQFTYTRDQSGTESHMSFAFTLEGGGIGTSFEQLLLDSGGSPL